MKSDERWKAVPKEGFEKYYEVSNKGNVRNAKTKELLKQQVNREYYRVSLRNPTTKKNITLTVHKAVLKAFCEDYDEKMICNHIDGNKLNNELENLEFGVSKQKNKSNNNNTNDDNENEEWKPLPHENLGKIYEISNLGNIRNSNTKELLKYKLDHGHYRVSIKDTVDNKMVTITVYRAVLEAFDKKYDKKAMYNHIDEKRQNNKLSNLELINKKKKKKKIKKKKNKKKKNKNYIIITENINDKNISQTEEVWRQFQIKGVSNIYEISNFGNIRNFDTGKQLTFQIKMGYYSIKFKNSKTNEHLTFTAGRLVLLAFKGLPNKEVVCNHIDGNKLNNRLENLEWITQKENTDHARETGLTKVNKKAVIKLDKDENFINEYDSIEEAAEDINLTRHAIIRVLSGKNKTAGGFKWKYKDESNNKIDIPQDSQAVKNYPDYLVCKDGKIYSKIVKRYLKENMTDNGYTYVTLNSKDNRYVHTLVAEAFLNKNNSKQTQVNHIDKNKSNNKVENLEWCTASENMKHAKNTKSLNIGK